MSHVHYFLEMSVLHTDVVTISAIIIEARVCCTPIIMVDVSSAVCGDVENICAHVTFSLARMC